jgi:hypothetical protein
MEGENMTTAEELLVRRGLIGPKDLYLGEVGKVYVGLDLLNAPVIYAIHSDGALVVHFVMTDLTGMPNLINVLGIIRELYGDTICDWINSHFNFKTDSVTSENFVVDSHWVSVRVGRELSEGVFEVILSISPDQNPPKDVYLTRT